MLQRVLTEIGAYVGLLAFLGVLVLILLARSTRQELKRLDQEIRERVTPSWRRRPPSG